MQAIHPLIEAEIPVGDSVTPGGPDMLEQPLEAEEATVTSDDENDTTEGRLNLQGRRKHKKNAKRRGAPFKGNVSNNKVEKFKPQRQMIFRAFKQFYERRIMPGIGVDAPKRKRIKDASISEEEQRRLSRDDSFKLFGSDFLANVSD